MISQFFNAKNTGNVLFRNIEDGTGTTPYVTASAYNNGVVAYIDAGKYNTMKGGCILVGGKTFTLTYQNKDFISNDSHNFTLTLKTPEIGSEDLYLFLLTIIRSSLSYKYTWGDAVTKEKILNDEILLPIKKNGDPDWEFMVAYIKDRKNEIRKIGRIL